MRDVPGGMLPLLGISPVLGRNFLPEEEAVNDVVSSTWLVMLVDPD